MKNKFCPPETPFSPLVPEEPDVPLVPDEPLAPPIIQFAPLLVINKLSY